MKRGLLAVVLAGAAGCSNAPIAGFLDLVAPSPVKPSGGQDRPGPPSGGGNWNGPVVPEAAPAARKEPSVGLGTPVAIPDR